MNPAPVTARAIAGQRFAFARLHAERMNATRARTNARRRLLGHD